MKTVFSQRETIITSQDKQLKRLSEMKITLVLRNKKNALKLSTRSLESFIERIKTDTKNGIVARRRQQLSYDDYIQGFDQQYPSHIVYPSAEFRKDDNDNLCMKNFNGVVALTVEGLDARGIEAVKRAAQILHYTLAAFVGPSGREVIILVRITNASPTIGGIYSEITQPYPTEEEADVLCQEGHRLAVAIYQGIIPKPINKEPISVKSHFHMPLDPAPYFNPKAVALHVSPKPMDYGDGASDNNHQVVTNQENCDANADEESQEVSQKTKRLMDFLNAHYQLRYNTTMGYTEYKDNDYRYMEWMPVDSRTLKGMTMKVRLNGIDARDNDVRRYVQSNMIRPYNPVGDYLWEQYYKWDGKDHIRKLARTVPTTNPYWEEWFYTWFLGMVRQWQVTNLAKYGNQAVPLLISEQGWNKTTFCEQLLPPELRFGYTGNLQLTDKRQVLQQMAQMLLINLDEFNQISPQTQQGFLKNIITLSSVKIKRPYGHHVEDFPRRASFIATTNQADVLADPSGSRRFLGIQLTGPIDVSTPPNYEQLYAQAMRALHQHEPYYFGPEATQQIIESNRKFSVRTAAEQFFRDYFDPASSEKDGVWMSATAILSYLKDEVGISLLKPVSVVAFGRKLSGIKGLMRRETKSNSEYLVKLKERK